MAIPMDDRSRRLPLKIVLSTSCGTGVDGSVEVLALGLDVLAKPRASVVEDVPPPLPAGVAAHTRQGVLGTGWVHANVDDGGPRQVGEAVEGRGTAEQALLRVRAPSRRVVAAATRRTRAGGAVADVRAYWMNAAAASPSKPSLRYESTADASSAPALALSRTTPYDPWRTSCLWW